MRLADCLQKIDDMNAWEIRFYEEQPRSRPIIHTVTDNLHRLFRGWLKGGPNSSGSQGYVYAITFSDYHGHVYLIDDSEYMTFQELMERVKVEVADRLTPAT